MKKILSIALAGALAVSGLAVFAGCGGGIPEVDWNVDLSKPIELNGLYPQTGMQSFGKDDTAKIIEKTTGYKVHYEELGASADNEVQKYLAARQEPFHFMKLTEAQYHPYLSKGAFCDLTDLLQNTAPGRILYQLIDLMDYGWDSVTYVDPEGEKHIYGIPDFGYVAMTDSALIWNKDHLDKIGFKEHFPDNVSGLPETLTEFDWALQECQNKFGKEANNSSYHALGLPGSNSNEVTALKGAFEVPFSFYVDDEGNIQQYEFSEGATMYAQYMHRIRYMDILSPDWQQESAAGLNNKFSRQYYSCVFLPYWNVDALVSAIKSYGDDPETKDESIAAVLGIPNTADSIKSDAIGWQLRIRGDGFEFETDDGQTVKSPDQEVARIEGGAEGVSYYTVIPAYMQDKALYVIDFLAKKMEYFGAFYGGNGLSLQDQEQYGNDPSKFPIDTHWYEIPTPDGAPGKEDYDGFYEKYAAQGIKANQIGELIEQNEYNQYEDLKNKVIFLRPYSFTYNKYSNKDASLGNRLSEDESQLEVEKVTYSQPGMWVKLTGRYIAHINDNSQYCNGTNAVSARVLFHLRETGYGAWRVVIANDDTLIRNPMAMCPPFENWSKVSISCRTKLKNGISAAIDAKPVEGKDIAKETLDNIRASTRGTLWTAEIVKEMTDWYKEVKLNRQ